MHGRFPVDVVSLLSMTQQAPSSDAAAEAGSHAAVQRRTEKDVVQEVPSSNAIA